MKIWIAVAVLTCAGCVCGAAGQSSNNTQKPTKPTRQHHVRRAHHGHPATGHARAAQAKEKPFVNQGPMAPKLTAPVLEEARVTPEVVEPKPEPVVVTYDQGALGITARDGSLKEVLSKLQEATGAPVDAPSVDKHITVKVEAQAPAGALRELLDGTQLDYAMLGGTSMNDPVRRIIIAPRMAPGRGTSAPVQTLENTEVRGRTAETIQSEQTGGDEGVLEPPATPPQTAPSRRH